MARNVLARTYPGSKATAWCHAAPALSRLPVSSSAIASRSQASALRESSARARRIARSTGPRVVGDRKSTTSELQSLAYLVCRLLLEKKKVDGDTVTCRDCTQT